MSLRLTPSAHKKNSVVTRTNGATYRRSVSGAEVVMDLGQGSVQMHITAIDEQMLSGDVRGTA